MNLITSIPWSICWKLLVSINFLNKSPCLYALFNITLDLMASLLSFIIGIECLWLVMICTLSFSYLFLTTLHSRVLINSLFTSLLVLRIFSVSSLFVLIRICNQKQDWLKNFLHWSQNKHHFCYHFYHFITQWSQMLLY